MLTCAIKKLSTGANGRKEGLLPVSEQFDRLGCHECRPPVRLPQITGVTIQSHSRAFSESGAAGTVILEHRD